MDPFLTIPIALPGDETKGNSDKVVDCKILPAHVLAYHRGYAWGTCIYLTTGQAFMSTLEPQEYERHVQSYWQEVEKNVRRNNKLKFLQ